ACPRRVGLGQHGATGARHIGGRRHDTRRDRAGQGYRTGLAREPVRIELVRGDVTEQDVDAIVNAANHTLLGGGGGDRAIHRKGGPVIQEGCGRARRDRCPEGARTGQAVATAAGRLPATWVSHTVCPDYAKTNYNSVELASCHTESLHVADEVGARTV